ncbi:glycosyl hydrolase [Microtetraspora sp. NBRC 16547]|uniref:glycoside hydrolase family 26 protein n=1 Tax=Microtetraspora sp. NBRC 16547 TaxID=3030993 RepID=UPI0024A4A140|nr:glycosyl hydrolase [Microtetraspora sp. NBRC 16547]GLW99709.1 hypothetical protein Misp02_37960 [Microtetraspora sp. NBRC 16547]
MRGRRLGLTALCGVVVLTAALGCRPDTTAVTEASPTTSEKCPPDDRLVPRCGAWWGISTPPLRGSLSLAVESVESDIGRRFALVYDFHDMSQSPNGVLLPDNQRELGDDRILMLAWVSEEWSTGTRIPWTRIASGELDASVIDPQARRIKEYGKPVMIAFDQEMDLRGPQGAGTPEEYIAAYRHIQDRFAEIGATNAIWAWIITGYHKTLPRQKEYYPGDDRVDWIGFDQYNFFTCQGHGEWRSFRQTVQPTYDWLRANGLGGKPIILSEFGTEDDPQQPGRKAEWYLDVPKVVRELSGIKAVVQWNSESKGCDFRISEPNVLSSYARAGMDPYLNP